MSTIEGLSSIYSAPELTESSREPSQDLDRDAFLQLLVTQLRYQDPLNPMDNQEMMAQLAQFSALEQMTNVAQATESQLVHGLVGKYIQYQVVDSATGIPYYPIGKVDYITMSGGNTFIAVDGLDIDMSDVVAVFDPSAIQSNGSAFELIGKTVQAVIEVDSSEFGGQEGNKEEVVIEGEVLSIVMEDGEPFVVIGTGERAVEIALEDVQNVVEQPSLTGKIITATWINEEDEEVEIEGVVEYIVVQEDNTYLYVDGIFIDFDDIETVH